MQDNKDSPLKNSTKTDILERSIHSAAQSGFKWLLSTSVIWQIISWCLTLFTARLLTPKEFGIVSMSETVAPYFFLVACFGIDGWLIQRRDLTKKEQSVAFTLNALLGSSMMFLAYFVAPLLAEFYKEPCIEEIFKFSSLVVLLRALQVVSAARLRREFRFKTVSLLNLSIGVGRSLLQLLLVYLGYSYWSLVIGGVVKEVAFIVAYLFLSPTTFRFSWDLKLAREIFKFGLSTSGAAALWIVFSTADNVIIGRLFGNQYLGLYAMAFFLSELPFLKINQIITPLVMPYYSGLAGDLLELKEVFIRTNRLIITLVVPPLLGLAVVADEFVFLVLGENWMAMSPILKVLCFVGVFRGIVGNSSPLFNALSTPHKSFYSALAPAIFLPPAFYFFGTLFGVNGIYLVWLVVYPIVGLYVSLRLIDSSLTLSPARYLASVRAPIITSVLMAICCYFSPLILPFTSPLALMISKIGIGVFTWIVFYLALFPNQSKNDLSLLKGLLSRN